MGYRVLHSKERSLELRAKYGPRPGLEGPVFCGNGRVLYYDPRAGQYWDPTTDFYLPHDEALEAVNSY